jgi:amino acid transporter
MGNFFKALAEAHPRLRAPAVAIVVQCRLAVTLLLLGGSLRRFFSLAIFAAGMFHMIAGSRVCVFRRRESAAARPYGVWGTLRFGQYLCSLLRRFFITRSPTI